MRTSSRSFPSLSGSGAGHRAAAARNTYRTGSDTARFEPLVYERRLIGEDRVKAKVLERHRAVQGDRQPQGGQRRTAQLEEVVPPPDLVSGYPKDLRPRGGQPVLGRRARPFVVLASHIQLSGERRQSLLVGLPVARHRKRLSPME